MKLFPPRQIRQHLMVALVFGFLGTIMFAHVFDSKIPWVPGIGIAIVLFLVFIEKYIRRYINLKSTFPNSWRLILESRVPFYTKLAINDRIRFENDISIFLSEQRIYGVRGELVNEEIKVLIASSAATLGFGLPDWEWPNLRDVLVYPSGFDEEYNIQSTNPFKGMVHQQGPIIFSEEDLKLGYYSKSPTYNVGLHEMAHVLDMADGRANGIPTGMTWFAAAPWVKVMVDRIQKVRKGECKKILRDYAGVNEAEFFAVAVEVFYQNPDELRKMDFELFSLLEDYFGVDPGQPSGEKQ
ncbi:zinc-dependent peptidase [bacterium]|nr:zinc-dependent peptidase [bacterium]